MRAYRTNKVRLYLTFSLKEKDTSALKEGVNPDSLLVEEEQSRQSREDSVSTTQQPEHKVSFIGSSAQGQQLIEEQNLAYEQSLKCDIAKSEALKRLQTVSIYIKVLTNRSFK